MHERHLESRSLDLQSFTSQFERDKLLYYQAIQDSSSFKDFNLILRGRAARSDDSASRALLLSRSWAEFSSIVNEHAVRILTLISVVMCWQLSPPMLPVRAGSPDHLQSSAGTYTCTLRASLSTRSAKYCVHCISLPHFCAVLCCGTAAASRRCLAELFQIE
jgi:hypothetical protein